MAGVGEGAVGAIIAAAAVASAGAAVYSATQGGPKGPKAPTLPVDKSLTNPAPDTNAIDLQRQKRALLAGRSGTILTGPGGLGVTGTPAGAAQSRSTLLGM